MASGLIYIASMRHRVKSSYEVSTPLGIVPSGDWMELINQKIRWAGDRLNVDIGVAFEIIEDFDKNNVWGFLGEPRDYVIEHKFRIPPPHLNRLRTAWKEFKDNGGKTIGIQELGKHG